MVRMIPIYISMVLALISCSNKSEIPTPIHSSMDSLYQDGSSVEINTVDKRVVDDLALLCKVWGLLKYHHPAIASGEIHWDYELFRMIPKVLNSNSSEERDQYLLDKIKSLGDVEIVPQEPIDSSMVKIYPDFSWVDSSLSNSLVSELKDKFINSRLEKKNIYLDTDLEFPEPFTRDDIPYRFNEKIHYPISYDDAGYILLSLFRFWNTYQYFSPYRYLTEKDWNDILVEYIPKFLEIGTELEYLMSIKEILAEVNDTHAQILSHHDTKIFDDDIYYFPADVRYIEDKIVVTEPHRFVGGYNSLKRGDIIVSVNSEKVEDIVERELRYISGSNNYAKMRIVTQMSYFLSSKDSIVNLSYKRGNKLYKADINISNNRVMNNSFSNNNPWGTTSMLFQHSNGHYKVLKKGIGYIDISKYSVYTGLTDDQIKRSILNETNGIIVDMRVYPTREISYLEDIIFKKDSEFVKYSYTYTMRPGLFMLTDNLATIKAENQYYDKKIVVLVNEHTQSWSEFLTMKLSASPNVTVIGSTTSGADGPALTLALPGGVDTYITSCGIYYPDGGETQRVGVRIDEVVKPTIEGIIEGRDEVFERAVEILSNDD